MLQTPDRTLVAQARTHEHPLRDAYRAARAAGAQRHRDIAAALKVSEAELIAAHTRGPAEDAARPGLQATRLRPEWPAVMAAMPQLGRVMALTRNAHCVHEKTGRYEQVSGDGPVGLVLGPDIDLRVFYRAWACGFAVQEHFDDPARPVQRSLQFFDASGTAVHKVFTRPDTDLDAWHALARRFSADADDSTAPWVATPASARATQTPDDQVDLTAFHRDWAALRDTHEFFGLIKRHGLARLQALRLAEARFVRQVDAQPDGAVRDLLLAAAGTGTPIMVFVGNPGMIQIHSGAVKRVQVLGPWLNVLDPGFNLHLREDQVASAWVVRKPTSDGLVSSLELFDADGETIAMFFGERKPGRPELAAWRQLLDTVVGDASWSQEAACSTC